MRKIIVSLVAIVMITGAIFAGDLYRKTLNIDAESSENFSRNFAEEMTGTVQLSGLDLGSGRIIAEVYDPNGRKIASGSRRFSFNTKNIRGSYKIVVINRTNKRQKVEVSVSTSES